MPTDAESLREQITALVAAYHDVRFVEQRFEPGRTPIPCSAKVFDADEMVHLMEAALDFWLTAGRFAKRFEKEFAAFMGCDLALLTNSGSSANLLAVSCLTSPQLGRRALLPGDEVITVASGFPTTVAPILQNGLVPVFVDVSLPSYNVDVRYLEEAVSKRTRGLVLAHTLGNPFDVDAVLEFVRRHDLWLVEDCCDAVGSLWRGRPVGTFGQLATTSFYPAHHLTMGEGGCVLTSEPRLASLVASFRDWGRDCWCGPGDADTCGRRFDWSLGDLPRGYDHKYIFSHVGYNLKITDLQAAVGVAQLAKLPAFVEARRRNFATLRQGLAGLEDLLVLPEATPLSEPSWFGFPLTVREGAPFDRLGLTRHLEAKRIGTRPLFGGNLVRQPAFRDAPQRRIGDLAVSDVVAERTFWIGVHPALTAAMLEYVVDTLIAFCSEKSHA